MRVAEVRSRSLSRPLPKRRNNSTGIPEAAGELLDLPLDGTAEEIPPEPLIHGQSSDAPLDPAVPGDLASMDYPGPRRRLGSGWLWLVLLLSLPIGALVGYFASLDPPVAALSVEQLDFGEVRLGAAAVEGTVRVSNLGEQKLWLPATVILGSAEEDYRRAADDCAGRELPAAASCEVRLSFEPTARGERRAIVRFDSNAANGDPVVELIGIGAAAELIVEPAKLDLGSQLVGNAGASRDLLVSNRGTAPLQIGRVDLGGAQASDFLRVADGCSSRPLSPGAGCRIRITFVPRAAGDRRASLQIPHDASDDAATVPLLGFASPREPLLQILPESLDFAPRRLGVAGSSQRVEVVNAGNVPIRVRGLSIDGRPAGRVAGAFELTMETCLAEELQPGGRCVLEVSFAPISEGAQRGVLALESTASRTAHQVLLTGTGAAPQLRLEPERLRFGAVGVGVTSDPSELHLVSAGTAELRIGDVSIGGSDASAFAVSGCAGRTLVPNRGCALEVFFRPRRAGPHRADLVIRHDAASRQVTVPLNGIGVTARLSVEPGVLRFGEVPVGAERRLRLELSNSGRTRLTVRRLRLTGSLSSGFDIVGDRCSDATLEPEASCTVEVRFRPASAGARSQRLAIEHGTSQRPVEVSLEGVATGPPG